MARARTSFRKAVTAHRQALGLLAAVRTRLEQLEGDPPAAAEAARQQADLVRGLAQLAAELAPGWWGGAWQHLAAARPPPALHGPTGRAVPIRIADAEPLPGLTFPVVVPLIGAGHLAIDADGRDPAVNGLLRAVLTRILAAYPPGQVRVLAVDGGGLGAVFAPFRELVPAGLMTEPAVQLERFRGLLAYAEEQVRRSQAGGAASDELTLLVAAALPPGCTRTELARLAALAHAGPAAGVHLVLAGYPPPSGRRAERAPVLDRTTRITALPVPSGPSGPAGPAHSSGPAHPSGRAGPAGPGGRPPAVQRVEAGLTDPFASPSASTGAPPQPPARPRARWFRISDPPGGPFGAEGRGLNARVRLDPAPPEDLVAELCRLLAARTAEAGALDVEDLIPGRLWTQSSVTGLRTPIGRSGRSEVMISLDDATPHWLIGGRTGSGKTVFLLDVLYGLVARYSPDELSLYLLDFKEGVSFTEFIPTERDPTWIPHARTVGVESDRQYGLAVLAELVREMGRRAASMKQAGVSNLADLRGMRPDTPMPRMLTVIDEFHVLLSGNDRIAKQSVALLEEVARKGRSYGVHLVLASQSVSGIEALYAKGESVFGQFGLRVALPGGGGVLGTGNDAADVLALGEVVLNDAAGAPAGNRVARFPDADQHSLALLRHRIWQERTPGALPPAVFIGYAEYLLEHDPTYLRLEPGGRRITALLGRQVEIGLPGVGLAVEPVPGAHLAVLGTSPVGADLLRAAVLSLARQYSPGVATFLLAGLVPAADSVLEDIARGLVAEGQYYEVLGIPGYRDALARLAGATASGAGTTALAAGPQSGPRQPPPGTPPAVAPPPGSTPDEPVYLVVFGAEAASAVLRQPTVPGGKRTGLDDLRAVLRDGPGRGVHLLGWWRGVRRLVDDVGTAGRDEVGTVLALNVRGEELSGLLGRHDLDWTPRADRALLIDRHEDTQRLLVPFVTPGRLAEVAADAGVGGR